MLPIFVWRRVRSSSCVGAGVRPLGCCPLGWLAFMTPTRRSGGTVRTVLRPLDRVYPVVLIDAVHVKIRNGQVANRPVYVAVGGHR